MRSEVRSCSNKTCATSTFTGRGAGLSGVEGSQSSVSPPTLSPKPSALHDALAAASARGAKLRIPITVLLLETEPHGNVWWFAAPRELSRDGEPRAEHGGSSRVIYLGIASASFRVSAAGFDVGQRDHRPHV